MDYGPFGFMDKYDPAFAKWVGSGDHFAFMNQPGAGLANLGTLATALEPILDAEGKKLLKEAQEKAKIIMKDTMNAMWCSKLGLAEGSAEGVSLFADLESLMRHGSVDYLVLFRQLAQVPGLSDDASTEALLEPLLEAFYSQPDAVAKERWAAWLRRWLAQLSKENKRDGATMRMNSANPKYTLREYILVQAYTKAQKGDYSMVEELYNLIRSPYDEQPELAGKYYQRAPDVALETPGTAVMT